MALSPSSGPSSWLPPVLLLLGASQLRRLLSGLHEAAHALLVVLTGGTLHAVTWFPEAQVAFSGGWPVAVLGVGYLAPGLLGAALVGRRGQPWIQAGGALLLVGALLDVIEDRGTGDAALLAQVAGGTPAMWSTAWGAIILAAAALAALPRAA